MNLSRLPHDLFLLITDYLLPRDLIRCRRVSRTFHAAFTLPDANLAFLRRYYPRCRELRLAAALDAVTCLPDAGGDDEGVEDNFALLLILSIEAERKKGRDWARVFARVARRYWFLETAQARVVEKVRPALPRKFAFDKHGRVVFGRSTVCHPVYRFVGVAPWAKDRNLEPHDRFSYPAREWAYGAEDALLLYPAPVPSVGWRLHDGSEWDEDRAAKWNSGDYAVRPSVFGAAAAWTNEDLVRCPYRLRDLETGLEVAVPFNVDGKIMRAVRLVAGILVFEWAELEPHDPVVDEDSPPPLPRHTASIFDVVRVRYPSPGDLPSSVGPQASPLWSWALRWRRDIQMHPDGFALDDTACFFSTHDAKHYAVYVGPTSVSSMDEFLTVWDMATGDDDELSAPAPRPLRELSWIELDFAGVARYRWPRLRGLALDDHNIYFVEEGYCWPGTWRRPATWLIPRSHLVRTVGIAVIPMPTTPASPSRAEDDSPAEDDECPIYGPHQERLCSLAESRFAFCELCGPESDPGSDDDDATVSPIVQLDSSTLPSTGPRFVWHPPGDGAADVSQTLSSSRAYPFANHRPASAPPCWRHDRFPYLTVSEVVDAAAGIRFAARDGFVFKRMAVHLEPALTVKRARRADNNGSKAVRWDDDRQFLHPDGDPAAAAAAGAAGGDDCAPLADLLVEMELQGRLWHELMGKGYITGDERWIVGEDAVGDVTIVRF